MINPKRKQERNISIIKDYRAGMLQTEIAVKYGISKTRVQQIIKDRRYKTIYL